MALSFLKKLRQKKKDVENDAPIKPSEQVLSTYELLESILSHLPPSSLRRVRGVCTAWNNLIHRSYALDATRKIGVENRMRLFRLLLLGVEGSGKTCLITNWVTSGVYLDEYDPTLSENFRKLVRCETEPWLVDLQPANSTTISPLIKSQIENSDGYALVYSVSSRAGFEAIRTLNAAVTAVVNDQSSRSRQFTSTRHVFHRPCGLIATKCDLDTLLRGWDVTHAEGAALAAELGCALFETSAQSGEGVEEAFQGMLKAYRTARIDAVCGVQQRREEDGSGGKGGGGGRQREVETGWPRRGWESLREGLWLREGAGRQRGAAVAVR